MKTLIAVLTVFPLVAAFAGPYGPHTKGKVTVSEWEAILTKFHASRRGSQENWDKAEAEVARVRNLATDRRSVRKPTTGPVYGFNGKQVAGVPATPMDSQGSQTIEQLRAKLRAAKTEWERSDLQHSIEQLEEKQRNLPTSK